MSYDPTVYSSNSPGGGQGPNQPNPYEETVAAPNPSNPSPTNYSYNPYRQNQPPQPAGAGASYPPSEQYGAPPPPPPNVGANPYQPGSAPPPPNVGVNQYPQYAQNIPPVYQPAGGITTPPAGGKSSSTGKIVLIVLAVLVILGGLGAAIGISARNNQIATNNARATATANTKNATATAQTYATATAAASTYPFSATLKWGDPLSDNSHGHGWPMDNRCQFAADGYHAVNPQSNSYITCPAMKTSLSDFTYQVSMQITQGEVGGLTFRGDDNNSRYYSFIFDQSGAYVLFIYKNKGEKPTTLHEEGATSHFKANQKNELGVVARGSQITLYVNKQKLTTVHDSTFSSGQIGVIVYNFGETVEAVFTDAKVWQL